MLQASPSFWSTLSDHWHQLSQGTRENIVGGLVVAAILALIGLLWKFGKRIWKAITHIFQPTPEAAPTPPPQEVKVRIEVTPTTSAPLTVPTEPPRILRSSNIPRPPAFGFVARRDQEGRDILERLKEELAPEKNQLITLWGAGGVGKTTLAIEVSRALTTVFEGGVAWISADGKPEFALATLLDEIATHLQRPELRQLALDHKSEGVHHVLADAPTPLLVLDNFETISPEEQDACAEWLAKRASCPALITSRDEVTHARPIHILAMSLPEAREFLQKLIAQARRPKAFEGLDNDQLIQVAGRIPLVVQWLIKQIDAAKEPQSVLDDLSQGKGDAAERVFDRSFELAQLGDDGRSTLLALSLFVPSATRVALAEVAGFGGDSDRLDKAVQQLNELWLIETTQGNERVSVEGLTRQLASARLSKDAMSENFRKRFVAYFLKYAGAYAKPTAEDYEALENEKENVLSAMDVAFDMKDWQMVTALAYVVALPVSGVLSVHGYWDEAIKRNKQALEAARKASAEYDVSSFAHNQAIMHENRGELEEARQLYNQSLEIVKKLGNESGIAKTLHELGRLAQTQGHLEEARQLYNQSLEIVKKLGNQSGIANTLHQLGLLAQVQGESEEARQLYNQSLEIKNKLGNQIGIAITLHQLGRLSEERGNADEATRLFREALAIWEKLGSPSADLARRSLARVLNNSS